MLMFHVKHLFHVKHCARLSTKKGDTLPVKGMAYRLFGGDQGLRFGKATLLCLIFAEVRLAEFVKN